MGKTVKIEFQGREYDAVPVEVNQANELWNQYLLDDGSVLKLKTVVTSIVRVPEVHDQEGNPVYLVKSGNVVTVTSPEPLRKK
jgi:hypothetical protein